MQGLLPQKGEDWNKRNVANHRRTEDILTNSQPPPSEKETNGDRVTDMQYALQFKKSSTFKNKKDVKAATSTDIIATTFLYLLFLSSKHSSSYEVRWSHAWGKSHKERGNDMQANWLYKHYIRHPLTCKKLVDTIF